MRSFWNTTNSSRDYVSMGTTVKKKLSSLPCKMYSAFQQKEPPKFSPSDWHTANYLLASSSNKQRQISHDIRQNSETTRNVKDNVTHWTQHDTNTNLDFRVRDVDEWKKILTKTLQNVETEINTLGKHKSWTEKALEAKKMPLEVVLKCLSLREQRISIDLVKDEVEDELHKELEVLDGIQRTLHLKITGAFEQLCILQDCWKQLSVDLDDKQAALSIDSTCVSLSNTTETLSMQQDPTRLKNGITTPKQWEAFSLHNNTVAIAEMQTSVRMRETMDLTIRQTTSDLEAQWTATNYAYRKRINELELAEKELEWQKRNTEKEIAQVKEEIHKLDRCLAEKKPPMMVAQTRLENRIYRPNVELCRDKPQYGLVEEVGQVTETMQTLQEKLEIAEHTLGTLERALARITQDLSVKTTSLIIDGECSQLRLQLAEHPNADKIMVDEENL